MRPETICTVPGDPDAAGPMSNKVKVAVNHAGTLRLAEEYKKKPITSVSHLHQKVSMLATH